MDTDTDFDAVGAASVLNGGEGADTFKFTTSDGAGTLNLTNSTEVSTRLSGIEILDMRDGGVMADILNINKDVVNALGDNNNHTSSIIPDSNPGGSVVDIYVRGDGPGTADTVNLQDAGWSIAPDTITLGSEVYDIWTNGIDGDVAVIAIQQGVTVNIP